MKNPQTLTFIPFTGLGQKRSPLLKQPGVLEEAWNVESEVSGELNTRRGYRTASLRNALNSGGETLRRVSHAATLRNELVVFGYQRILALASKTAAIGAADSTFVDRGVSNRGALSVQYVTTSRASRNA